jgi:hypothetical protein
VSALGRVIRADGSNAITQQPPIVNILTPRCTTY